MNPQIGQIWRYVNPSVNLDMYCFLVKEITKEFLDADDRVFLCRILATENRIQEAYFTKHSAKRWTWIS